MPLYLHYFCSVLGLYIYYIECIILYTTKQGLKWREIISGRDVCYLSEYTVYSFCSKFILSTVAHTKEHIAHMYLSLFQIKLNAVDTSAE